MTWNWELPEWPNFTYDTKFISSLEKAFLIEAGKSFAYLNAAGTDEHKKFIVEILTLEGENSAKIEGETLDRQSLQSSIKKHFGFHIASSKQTGKETNMAKLLCSVYDSFDQELSHEMLWSWHFTLFEGFSHIESKGSYRSHDEPMQIVSNRYSSPYIFFEAPPSYIVLKEMTKFIKWFNSTNEKEPILGKAAIAHLYFESIHPFEDGNGRIGRALVEKLLSKWIGKPILIALSKVLEKKRKLYYQELAYCNKTLDAHAWVKFFTDMILEAHDFSLNLLYFLIQKSKMLTTLDHQINSRQRKFLLRVFEEGPQGFQGGLSRDNYISIAKTSSATATRDLNDLVQKNALIKVGQLRYTRYYLNLPIYSYLKED